MPRLKRPCEDISCLITPTWHPYLALLPVGLALPVRLPVPRCALTAPFHPYPCRNKGGLFSVALSLRLPWPGVTRHRCFMESGLSSIQLRTAATQPSVRRCRLAVGIGWVNSQSRRERSSIASVCLRFGPCSHRRKAQAERGQTRF